MRKIAIIEHPIAHSGLFMTSLCEASRISAIYLFLHIKLVVYTSSFE